MFTNIFSSTTKYKDCTPIVYDIETYKNLFCCICQEPDGTTKEFTFENIDDLVSYFNNRKKIFAGYNNFSFDDIVIRYIMRPRLMSKNDYIKFCEQFTGEVKHILLKGARNSEDVYEFVKILFANGNGELNKGLDDFNSDLWKLKYYRNIDRENIWRESLDLMTLQFAKISKRNSAKKEVARHTDKNYEGNIKSLKEVGIFLELPKLQDLPYFPDSDLTEEQKQDVIKYCYNDVYVTSEFFKFSEEEISLRIKLEEMFSYPYNKSLMSEPRAGTAMKVLDAEYCDREGIKEKDFRKECEPCKEQYKNESIPCSRLVPEWVTFNTPELKKYYEDFLQQEVKIRNYSCNNEAELKQHIQFRGMTYSRALGGLHSVDQSGIFKETEDYYLIDVDVTSYYPSIMINNNYKPRHMSTTFIDILRDITTMRITAKRDKDKITAGALKIVINSLFGKTNNRYSSIYDPKSTYSTTITGQMGLLMLIEMLEENNIHVFSANTDGVTSKVPKDKLNEFRVVCKKWESITGFTLEETFYKKYLREHINSYIALKSDAGIKALGWFKTGDVKGKLNAPIIKEAVINHFIFDTPVESTIKDCKNIHKFIYYFKARGKFRCFLNGEELPQKVNRWYHSIDGDNITKTHKEKIEKKRAERTSKIEENKIRGENNKRLLKVPEVYTGDKIPNGESVQIVNDIKEFPSDIDYDHYILQARKIITKLEIPGKVIPKLQELGFFTMPKENKTNPIGFRQHIVNTNWEYRATGAGIYTGQNVGILVLDLDAPESLPDEVKQFLVHNPSFTIWHGSGRASDVQNGNKRGSVVYKFKNEALDEYVLSSPLKKYGFEILYGKPVQVSGWHPCGEEYVYEGILSELENTELEKIIGLCNKRSKKSRLKIEDSKKQVFIEEYINEDALYYQLQEIAASIINGRLTLKHSERLNRPILIGRCPFEDEHTSVSNDRAFNIYLTNEYKIFCNCHHESCSESRKELNYELNEKWSPILDQIIDKTKVEKQPELLKNIIIDKATPDEKCEITKYKKMQDSLEDSARAKLIQAEPGSGKTKAFAFKFVELIKNGERVLYITNNKSATAEFRDAVLDVANVEHLSEIFTQQIERSQNLEDNYNIIDETTEEEKIGDVLNSTLGLITHNTYASRKGHMTQHYKPVFNWLENNANLVHIFMDEVDSYVEAQFIQIQLEARYFVKVSKIAGKTYYFIREKCLSNETGRHSCHNCIKVCTLEWQENSATRGVCNLVCKAQFTNDDVVKGITLDSLLKIDKEFENIETGELLSFLKQRPSYLIGRKLKYSNREKNKDGKPEEVQADPLEAVEDLIQCSHNPFIWSSFPTTIKDEEIKKIDSSKLTKDITYKAPVAPCECRYLTCHDKSGLFYLNKYAKTITMASGTIKDGDREFIQAIVSNVKPIKIEESFTKISDILFIGFAGGLPEFDKEGSNLLKPIYDTGKVLRFHTTNKDAAKSWKQYGKSHPVGLFRIDTRLNPEGKMQIKYDTWEMLLTSVRGKLYRAVNLYEFTTCICDTRSFKPSRSYNLENLNSEEVWVKKEKDRVANIKQAYSRILRNNPNDDKLKKVIFLLYTNKEELAEFANAAKPLLEREPNIAFFNNELKPALKTIENFLKVNAGESFTIEPEKSKLDIAKEKYGSRKDLKRAIEGNKELSESASEIIEELKEERKIKKIESKKHDIIEKLKAKALEARQGVSWSQFKRNVNLIRHIKTYKLEQEVLDSLYNLFID